MFIYMYCNIEKNIMKNQSRSRSFGIEGKIYVFVLCFSLLYIFLF